MLTVPNELFASPMVRMLLDAAIRSSLVLLLAAGVVGLLRKRSAAWRGGVWASAIVLTLLIPLFSALLPSWRVDVLPKTTLPSKMQQPVAANPAPAPVWQAPRPAGTAPLPAGPTRDAGPSIAASEEPSPPAIISAASELPASTWVLIVWGLGAAGVLLPLLIGTVGIRRIACKARHITDADTLALKDRLCAEMAIRPPVLLLESERSLIPVTWGLLWPVVLLPRQVRHWPAERLRMVLLHELAHVRRKDCFVQLLVQLARAVYWFNPLVWWAARKLRIQRERACDDLVLAGGAKAPDYADQLLQIVRSLHSAKNPSLAAVAMARKSQFESRLLSLLDENQRRSRLSRRMGWTLLVIALAVAVPLAALQPIAQANKAAEEQILSYVHDESTNKRSIGGSGHAVKFTRGDGADQVVQVRIYASRYGYPQPPKEDFKVYLLDEKQKVIQEFPFPYSTIKRGEMKWYTLRIKPTVVPETFYVALSFNPHRTKGIYLGLDDKSKEPHSYVGLPERGYTPFAQGNWMVRVVLKGNGAAQAKKPAEKEAPNAGEAGASPTVRQDKSKEEIAKIVYDVVTDISTMAENDPRIPGLLQKLKNLDEKTVVEDLTTYFDSDKNTVRRSAIFILWKAGFSDTSPAAEGLIQLCSHQEDLTRGMTALALGGIKDNAAFEPLANMTANDKSAYARRCAAYALGLLGNPQAKPVLKKALKDPNQMVRNNAEAALTMLAKNAAGPSPSQPLTDLAIPQAVLYHVVGAYFQVAMPYWERNQHANAQMYLVTDQNRLVLAGLIPVYNFSSLPWTTERRVSTSSYNDSLLFDTKNPTGPRPKYRWVENTSGRGGPYALLWTPKYPLNPGDSQLYLWQRPRKDSLESTNGDVKVRMQNHLGAHGVEQFYLVVPAGRAVRNASRQWTSKTSAGGYDIYCFQSEVTPETNNVVTVTVAPAGGTSENKVEKANPQEVQAVKAATAAAEQWLKIIDAGSYGQSWEEMATLAKSAVTRDQWIKDAAPLKLFGSVQSRKLLSAKYTTSLPGAPDGQYVTLQFQTAFANKKQALETVTPMKDKDGRWRVSGYFVK